MLRILKQYYPVRNAVFVVGEGMFIFVSVVIATWIIIGNTFFLTDRALALKAFLIVSVCQLCLYYNDLYDLKITDTKSELFIRLLQALGASAIVLAPVYYLFPVLIIGKWIFNISIFFVIMFIVIWRMAYMQILRRGLFDQKIILLGSGDLANKIAQEIDEKKDCGYRVAAVIGGANGSAGQWGDGPDPKSKIAYGDFCKKAKALNIDKIIVAIEERRSGFPIRQLLDCRVNGIEVIEGSTFYEMLTGKFMVEQINPSWLIFSEGFRKSRFKMVLKRTSDLVLSLFMLILLAPILILVAILIKLDSKGPVFFSQERVGENRRPFMVHKFRSMVQDAEKESGPVWAEADDCRVTRIGKYIRKLRIDEFPQLFNVIKGEMSFVGPRPEREFFVEELVAEIPYYGERFSVKPGITGWAQVCYSYGASVEDAKEKLNYDLFYIKNMSIFMDLIVILKTGKTVLFGEGR